MQSIFLFTFFLGFHLTVFAQTSRFELGIQEYDLLNLETALKHFEAAQTELLVTNQNQSTIFFLAKVYLYQAATYFFLNDLDTAKNKIAEGLKYNNTCVIDGLKLPSLLYDYCTKLLLETKRLREDAVAQNLLDIPKQISTNNLEKVIWKTQKRAQLRQTGIWLTISSSLPLSLGIGFGVGAFFAKQEFQQNPSNITPADWRNYAIITDASLACTTILVTTGLILYLINRE
jgi:hypothetical protein